MSPNTPGGQITLAVISTKLDAAIELLKAQGGQLKVLQSCQDRMAYIPGDVGEMKKQIDVLQTDVASLQTQTKTIGGINAFLAIIAGTVGSLFNPKP
jgi:hypothetical protein